MSAMEQREKLGTFPNGMGCIVAIRLRAVKERVVEPLRPDGVSVPSILQSFRAMCHSQAPRERGNHAGKATGVI